MAGSLAVLVPTLLALTFSPISSTGCPTG